MRLHFITRFSFIDAYFFGSPAPAVQVRRRGFVEKIRLIGNYLFPGVAPADPWLPPVTIIEPRPAAIPDALKRHANRWGTWRALRRPSGKIEKVPQTPVDKAWGSFEWVTRQAKGRKDAGGIGFLVTVDPSKGLEEHGIVAIDLDKCVAHGEIDPWAAEVVAKARTYAEFSPSGTGIRLFGLFSGWADMPAGHAENIEIYAGTSARFVTVTGHSLPDSPPDLCGLPEGFLSWLEGLRAIHKNSGGKDIESGDVQKAEMPPLIHGDDLPLTDSLQLSERTLAFLAGNGDGEDRSRALAAATADLYARVAGDSDSHRDTLVLSILWENDTARAIALDHRGQDEEKALAYLWDQHCAKVRTRVRPVEEGFVATVDASEATASVPFERNTKGEILPTLPNVRLALHSAAVSGCRIRYDEFRDEIMIARDTTDEWRSFTDEDYTGLRMQFEQGGALGRFKPIGRELIRDAVSFVAKESRFDSAIFWLESLKHDGKSRIETFMRDYFGADDTPYTRAVSRYLWTALAGRVLSPGVKADMVPILVGAQGIRKSSGIAAIVPAPEQFAEISLVERDDNLARMMRGKLVGEIAELRGLHGRELEAVKAFITRTHEQWVPKYREHADAYARRTVFIGTTNEDEFLADDTGNRRWLPVKVTNGDPDSIARDRLQLWAEARDLFNAHGVKHADAQALAREAHQEHMIHDAWEHAILAWLDECEFGEAVPRREGQFTMHDVLTGALKMDAKAIRRVDEQRAGRVLKGLGFGNRNTRDGLRVKKVWRRAV
jgi:predicted P-loop ATPase